MAEEQVSVTVKVPKDWRGFAPVVSSNIHAVAYRGPAGENQLEVGDDNAIRVYPETVKTGLVAILFKNGTRYHYQGVPASVVTELVTAPSIGKAFNALLKGHEEYHGAKVDWQTGAALPPVAP